VGNIFVVTINVGRPGIPNYFDTQQILFIAADLIMYCSRTTGLPVSCIFVQGFLCPANAGILTGKETGKKN
jgi:hypothetical protein